MSLDRIFSINYLLRDFKSVSLENTLGLVYMHQYNTICSVVCV